MISVLLGAISKFRDCAELVTVTLCYYLLDSKSRHAFTNQDVAAIVIHVITSNHPDDVTCNAISCLFALSKRAHCREFLTEAPLHTDMHLLKLSQSEDPKIKANCARTLKNMTSDSSEALDEGAVANLIAMSLDGKEKATISEDLEVPSVIPAVLTDVHQPECAKYVLSDTMWFEAKMLVTGGPAGKGPEVVQRQITPHSLHTPSQHTLSMYPVNIYIPSQYILPTPPPQYPYHTAPRPTSRRSRRLIPVRQHDRRSRDRDRQQNKNGLRQNAGSASTQRFVYFDGC